MSGRRASEQGQAAPPTALSLRRQTHGALPTTSGRMPQAPASLLVQLPPDGLKYYNANRAELHALQRAGGPSTFQGSYLGPRGNGHGTATAIVQPSDVALLAASIQERREREARTFTWQQKLIGGTGGNGGGPTVDREVLKRALTQLSLPAWLQVLQERHLAQHCAYPTCPRRPKKPHLSQQLNPALPLDAPRYRISLRRRVIERDERDDAGGQNSFCSNTCWRRGEWVSRWVLNQGKSTRQVQRDVSDEAFGSAIRDAHGLGNEVDEGGRWERMMDEEHWTEIELLEDLEDKGEVDRLSDTEDAESASSKPSSPVSATQERFANQTHRDDVLHGQASDVAREHAKKRAQTKGTAEGFLNLLDSLVIQERQTNASTPMIHELPASPTAVPHKYLNGYTPEDKDDIVDELKFDMTRAVKSVARHMESDQRFDSHGDVSMDDDLVTPSLLASENIGSTNHEESGGLTEEERRQQKEEDDLFAQAWQAMSDEKAKGTWDVE